VGLTAVAGLSFFQIKPMGAVTYETMRPGSFDTQARLRDLDADGLWAQVLYPSVTLNGAKIYSEDRDLQTACVRAYNEWLLDFCKGSSGRLIAQAIIPTTGLDDSVAELEWAIKHGHRGAVISSFPNGGLDPTPEDARFWEVATANDFPIAVHIGSFLRDRPKGGSTGKEWTGLRFCGSAAITKSGGHTLPVACDILFSGIFASNPGLRIVLVEANIGWIPTLLEQADDMYMRYRWYTGAIEEQPEMPSQLFHRHFWATFMVDTVGMDLRHRMNLDHIMWSSDYPHSGTDWPNSRLTIERNFRGLPVGEVKKMLHTNVKELYGLDIPDRKPGR
jgi:predicted TIM-barrel fold metal-dependent hydrolase